jgi:hypothetical protein
VGHGRHRRPPDRAGAGARPALGGEALLTALRETPASEYVVRGPGQGQLRVLTADDVVKAAQG